MLQLKLTLNLLRSILAISWQKNDKVGEVTTQFGRLFHTLIIPLVK